MSVIFLCMPIILNNWVQKQTVCGGEGEESVVCDSYHGTWFNNNSYAVIHGS